MIPRVIDARHAGGYRLWLRFDDNLTGEIDLQSELWGPVFEALKDMREFAKLRADPELETLAWENGADLAPEFLYERVKAAKFAPAE
jgi:Protein of unknown function (DUF2442)